jgi:mycothiol synthase
VTIRPLVTADHDAIAALACSELTRDPYAAEIPAIVTRLPHVGLVAEVDGVVVGCCVGSRSRYGGANDAHLDLIIVSEAHQRRGIGRSLLEKLEAELVSAGCRCLKIEGNAPSYAWAGLDVHYTSGLCFIERMGFKRGHCALNMNVDLTADMFDTTIEQAELARNRIAFRRATGADLAMITELASRWRPRWVEQLTIALQGESSAVYLAHRSEDCVGFGAFGVNRVHELGPLGTEPEVRRQGVGGVLLKLCCAEQRSLGLERAELQWAGPLPYFSDVLRAQTGRVFWLYHKDLGTPEVPSDEAVRLDRGCE